MTQDAVQPDLNVCGGAKAYLGDGESGTRVLGASRVTLAGGGAEQKVVLKKREEPGSASVLTVGSLSVDQLGGGPGDRALRVRGMLSDCFFMFVKGDAWN